MRIAHVIPYNRERTEGPVLGSGLRHVVGLFCHHLIVQQAWVELTFRNGLSRAFEK
jgi:hypothetical protein